MCRLERKGKGREFVDVGYSGNLEINCCGQTQAPAPGTPRHGLHLSEKETGGGARRTPLGPFSPSPLHKKSADEAVCARSGRARGFPHWSSRPAQHRRVCGQICVAPTLSLDTPSCHPASLHQSHRTPDATTVNIEWRARIGYSGSATRTG